MNNSHRTLYIFLLRHLKNDHFGERSSGMESISRETPDPYGAASDLTTNVISSWHVIFYVKSIFSKPFQVVAQIVPTISCKPNRFKSLPISYLQSAAKSSKILFRTIIPLEIAIWGGRNPQHFRACGGPKNALIAVLKIQENHCFSLCLQNPTPAVSSTSEIDSIPVQKDCIIL